MKKILSGIIITCMLLMSLGNICYAAAFQPIIKAEGGKVGDSVTVTVSLPENTNAAGGSFNLVYDNTKMELIDAVAGDVIAAFSKTVNKTYAVNKIRMNFAGSETVSSSGGVMLTATFKLTNAGTASFSTEKFKLADIDTNYLTCTNAEKTISIAEESTQVSVTGVSLNKTTANLTVGDSETLIATVTPDNATNKTVTWKSSDESVATVSNGKVTAKAAGTATITVTTADGGKEATCTVTVTKKDEPTNAASITVGTVTAKAGETVTIPISISNNVGIAGFNLTINYDKTLLTPVSIEKGSALTAGTLTSNIQQGGDMSAYEFVTAYWQNPSNVTNNGEILNVTFKVAEGAEEGEIPVTITYEEGDITNQDYDDVALEITNGAVTVKNIVMGDVYQDGIVNTKDGVRLSQYLAKWEVSLNAYELKAADVYSDGVVNTKDGVRLSQYLAKWDVSLFNVDLFGQGEITFEVGEVSAKAGEYVDIPVSITKNTGVAGFNLQLGYDKEKLTPVSITQGGALTSGTITSNIQQGGDLSRFDTVTAYWVNPSNVTGTGEAFTVKFLVSEDAEGEIPVTLSYDEYDVPTDQILNELNVEIVNGVVKVESETTEVMDYTVNYLTGEVRNGSFYAEVSVTKNTDRNEKDTIIIAVYKDGVFVDMTYMKSEFAKGQSVVFGGKLTGTEGAVLKAFVWNSFEGMKDLSNTVEVK
ncbi:MAG: cohesin domain-containing protein [Clostridia bacterium]